MDRKYKQRGYMDNNRHEEESQTPRPNTRPEGPRTHRLPPVQRVFRCSLCGSAVPKLEAVTFSTKCPKCQSDLHSCKNCVHFDTGKRFECNQPITERVKRKDERNTCTFFEPRWTVERETTTAPEKMTDARAAFDRLFKK